jgi:hypothetical protein
VCSFNLNLLAALASPPPARLLALSKLELQVNSQEIVCNCAAYLIKYFCRDCFVFPFIDDLLSKTFSHSSIFFLLLAAAAVELI